MAELSTAVSDLVLAISALGGFATLLNKNILASLGFLGVAIAAAFGAYRFSRTQPSPSIISWHKSLAWLASTLGMSMIASGFHRHLDNPIMTALHMGCAIALVIMSKAFHVFSRSVEASLAEAISGAAVVSIGLFGFLYSNPFGVLGSIVFIAAGAVGTKEGTISGIKKVDWFHYFLCFANIVIIRALQFKPDAVYYKPKET